MLIDAGKLDSVLLMQADTTVKAGFYKEFVKHADTLQIKSGGMKVYTPGFTARVFNGWMDTVKNLTVLRNASIKKIERSRKGWEIDLTKGEIKADVIVDASGSNSVVKLASLKADDEDRFQPGGLSSQNGYRTSLALSGSGKTVPLSQFLTSGLENIITAAPLGEMNLLTGQAAGAAAAYCVFFKTNTKNLNVRKIQTELLSYGSQLVEFDDIADNDSSQISMQHIGVTGILKGIEQNGQFLFLPDSSVSTDEIRQSLKEYYSRSHIWFLDNKEEKLTFKTALSLIRFLASRGEELDRQVEKAWNTSLKIKGPFDLNRVVTRREFAILLDTYLQPYTVDVDIEGDVRR